MFYYFLDKNIKIFIQRKRRNEYNGRTLLILLILVVYRSVQVQRIIM